MWIRQNLYEELGSGATEHQRFCRTAAANAGSKGKTRASKTGRGDSSPRCFPGLQPWSLLSRKAGAREEGNGGFSDQVSHYSSRDRVSSPFFSANLQLALLRDRPLAAFPSSDAQRQPAPQGRKPARFRFLSEGGKVAGGGETQRTFNDTSGRSPPFFRLACKASGCVSPAPLVNEQLVETQRSLSAPPARMTPVTRSQRAQHIVVPTGFCAACFHTTKNVHV